MREMERSIFTIEEDKNAPMDLQIVSKRYIRGKDEVKEIGHDQPMTPNYDEDIEADTDQEISEQMGDNAEEERGVQADPQEILWTKNYQSSVHEGVQPETDRVVFDQVSDLRFFDMLSGVDLGDEPIKDSTCEVPGMVREDDGRGVAQSDEALLNDATPDDVPWFAVRKSWFSQKPPLPKKVIERIAKEENLPKDHFDIEKDIRQRVLQEEPLHRFSNKKVQPGYLVLIEARTNCLRKHFPGTDMGMGQSTVPPPQQNIYGESYLGNDLGQSTVPPPQEKVFKDDYIGQSAVPPAQQLIYDKDYIGLTYPTPTPQTQQYTSYPIPPQFQYQYGMPPPVYENAPPVILSADELKYGLGRIHLANAIFNGKSKQTVQTIKNMVKMLPLDTGIGELSLQLTQFTPPPFTPFKNTSDFMKNPPALPTFKNLTTMMNTKPPSPPDLNLSVDFKMFELSQKEKDKVKKAQDSMESVVTVWTNKTPPYEITWQENYHPGSTYTVKDPSVVNVVWNSIVKAQGLYKYKDFKVTDTGTWEPNLTRMYKGIGATGDIMTGMVKNFVAGLTASIKGLKDGATGIWDVVQGLPDEILANIKDNMAAIQKKGADFTNSMRAYGADIKTYLMNVIDAAKTDIGEVKDFVLSWVKGLTTAIMADAADLQTYVVNLFNSFSDWVKTNITSLVGKVKTEIASVVDKAKAEAQKIVADVENTVKNMVETVKNDMTQAYNQLKTQFTQTVDQVKADFTKGYNQLVSSLTGTIDIVKKQGEILTDQIKKVTDIQAAYEKFVDATGQRFSTIEEKMKSMGANIPSMPSAPSGGGSGEKKGLFASLFSGIGKAPAPAPIYPPAPTTQYPYAYPGAPTVYGTPTPWYDYEYTEVDMPATDFEKNPAPQATHGLGHISVFRKMAKQPFKDALTTFKKHMGWTASKEGSAETKAQAKKMLELIKARKFSEARTFAEEAPGGVNDFRSKVFGGENAFKSDVAGFV